jgi:hypothetical protein
MAGSRVVAFSMFINGTTAATVTLVDGIKPLVEHSLALKAPEAIRFAPPDDQTRFHDLLLGCRVALRCTEVINPVGNHC